jgi:integral membrane protein
MFSILNIFRIIALLEGLSYILLLGIATPIKYFANDPQYVKLLGMSHGLLFIAYIVLAILLKNEQAWTKRQFGHVLLASILPFGTFYIDRNYLKTA